MSSGIYNDRRVLSICSSNNPYETFTTFFPTIVKIIKTTFHIINTIAAIDYRPPTSPSRLLLRINNFNFNKIFLVGDFNLPNFDWINQIPLSADQLYLKIYEIMNDLFFTQVNTFVTRDKNILDLVLTSTPDLVTDLSVSEGFLHSDHLSISFSISTTPTCTRVMPKEILDFKKADMKLPE